MVEYSEKIKLQHLADGSNMILGPGHQTYQVVCNAKNYTAQSEIKDQGSFTCRLRNERGSSAGAIKACNSSLILIF